MKQICIWFGTLAECRDDPCRCLEALAEAKEKAEKERGEIKRQQEKAEQFALRWRENHE